MLDANDSGRAAQSALNAMLSDSDGVLNLLPIATVICDAKGTILQYNRRAVEVWGRAPEPGQTSHTATRDLRRFALERRSANRPIAG